MNIEENDKPKDESDINNKSKAHTFNGKFMSCSRY